VARRRASAPVPEELDAELQIRRGRSFELRIACQAIDMRVPGSRRWIDDPLTARRLAAARSQSDPLRRATLIEQLARDTLGDPFVDRAIANDRRPDRRAFIARYTRERPITAALASPTTPTERTDDAAA
jgi:hypothetical protein